MKRLLRTLLSLYPAAWRNRYAKEFEALLDDVAPDWKTLIDVLGGAMKMQLKIWSPWKIVAAFAIAGMLAASTFWLMVSKRYISQAVIKMGDGGPKEVQAQAQKIPSRAALSQLISREGLYQSERGHMPLDDVILGMKSRDIEISVLSTRGHEGVPAFVVSFAAPDAATAQRTAAQLAAAFVDANIGTTLLDPANLPGKPVNPRQSRIIVLGLIAGTLTGLLFALFTGLRIWKLAAALGIAGAVLCAGISYLIPERYSSIAVLRYEDASGMKQRIAMVTMDATLDRIGHTFGLYANDPRAARKLRERLHIEPIEDAKAVTIGFDYPDRFIAQKVTQDVVSRLMAGDASVEMLDPASLSEDPYFPNHATIATTGLFVGFASAIALGLILRRRSATPAGILPDPA